MTSIGDLVPLLYGAWRRVGPLSAELLISPARVDPTGQGEVRWRVIQDGARYRWELTSSSPHPRRRASSQPTVLVGDGERAWAQHTDRVVIRPYQGCLVADRLLDPSWLLAGYDLTITGQSELNGRPTRHITGALRSLPRGVGSSGEVIDAVVDAERGFLHRLSNVQGGEKFQVVELSDLHLDITVDDSTFSLVVPHGVRLEDRTRPSHGHLLRRRPRVHPTERS
jgi:outer membrane lipoprotein-sorting protein